MMQLLTRLTRSPGVWVAPIALLILFFRIQGEEESGEYYHVAVVLMDISAVTFIAPLVALAAAWEGWKLRYSGVLTMPMARSVARVTLAPIATAVVPASIVLALYSGVGGGASGFDWAMIAGGVFTLLAWALAGFGLGCCLPVVVALPIALLAPAAWMIFPRANEPLWLRHLTGGWTACCFMNQVVDPAAFWAAMITNAGIAILGLLLIWGGSLAVRRPRALGTAAVVGTAAVIIAGMAGAQLVSGFGYSPAANRTDATVCDSGSPKVCLWPEHAAIADGVRSALDEAAAEWSQRGIKIPAVFDERLALPSGPGVPLIVTARSGPEQWKQSFASALLARGCVADEGQGQATGGFDGDAALGWLMIAAGMNTEVVYQQLSPPAADAVRAHPDDASSSAWVNGIIDDMRACR